MPNWVSNTITAIGESVSDIDELIAQVSRPVPRGGDGDTALVYEETDFSFWNVKAPEPEIWEDYFSISDNKAPENNWYNWNCAHWGTKWDASETSVWREGNSVSFSFETAWAPVEEIVRLLSLQFRHLSFAYEYEEEQGWGGKMNFEAGETGEREEWDIPSSHEEYVKRDREDSCNCAWSEHREDWYDDCPGKNDADEGEE